VKEKAKIKKLTDLGMIPNHCYSILDVFPNKYVSDNQVVTLIRLRNPMGIS
jgi:hypothetical protein